ncbi:Uncharacterised protein r2_g1667 [Pycnogonum litorale]
MNSSALNSSETMDPEEEKLLRDYENSDSDAVIYITSVIVFYLAVLSALLIRHLIRERSQNTRLTHLLETNSCRNANSGNKYKCHINEALCNNTESVNLPADNLFEMKNDNDERMEKNSRIATMAETSMLK